MDDKITIIEGPPPVFEPIQDGWALGLGEGPRLPLIRPDVGPGATWRPSEAIITCAAVWRVFCWARNWQRLPEAADLYQMAVVKEVYN